MTDPVGIKIETSEYLYQDDHLIADDATEELEQEPENIETTKVWIFKEIISLKNEPLISCPFLSSKLDSPVIKTLKRHSLNVKNVSL